MLSLCLYYVSLPAPSLPDEVFEDGFLAPGPSEEGKLLRSNRFTSNLMHFAVSCFVETCCLTFAGWVTCSLSVAGRSVLRRQLHADSQGVGMD